MLFIICFKLPLSLNTFISYDCLFIYHLCYARGPSIACAFPIDEGIIALAFGREGSLVVLDANLRKRMAGFESWTAHHGGSEGVASQAYPGFPLKVPMNLGANPASGPRKTRA